MTIPVNTDNGVDYGYGSQPYIPPTGYAQGGYLDPNVKVPGSNLNNLNQRSALEIERLLVSGQVQYKDLTITQRRQFDEQLLRNKGYLTPGNTYDPQALMTMDQQLKQLAQTAQPGFKMPGWMKPLEWAGSKLYETYSKYVSRPVSAAVIYASQNDGNFGGHSWSDAWEAARFTSPGQAAYMGLMTDDELEKQGIKRDDLIGTRAAVDKYFTHGPQKWVSGAGDFAVAWYADPIVLGLRGASVARSVGWKMPIGGKGWNVDKMMDSTLMGNVDRLTARYVDKYGPNEAITRMSNEIPMLRNSNNGSGSRLAAALTGASSAGERSFIMRFALGDMSLAGRMDEVSDPIKHMLDVSKAKQSTINLQYSNLDPASAAGISKKAQLDEIAEEVSRLNLSLKSLDNLNGVWGSIDNLHFNSITTPLTASVRGAFQNAPVGFVRKGTPGSGALGNSGILPFAARIAYNGLYVPPVRFIRGFTDSAPIQFIKVNDDTSYKSVQALLRDATLLSPAFKNDMVGKYIAASAAERPMVLQNIERESVKAMASRHGVGVETANRMYRDFYMRRGTALETTNLYSTAKLADGTPIQVIEKNADGSILTSAPLLTSQLADSWVMMDMKRMNTLMSKQGKAMDRLLNENPNMLDEIRAGTRLAGDGIGGIADTLNNTWKFAQLARFGYGPRAITDELMSQVAAQGPLMMMSRIIQGARYAPGNIAERFFQGSWAFDRTAFRKEMFETSQSMIKSQEDLLRGLGTDLTRNQMALRDALSRGGTRGNRALRLQHEKAAIESKIANEGDTLNMLRETVGSIKAGNTMLDPLRVGSMTFKGALAGEGQMFRDPLSAERSARMLLGVPGGATGRSLHNPNASWSPIVAATDESGHMRSWLRDVNMQFRNDPLAMVRVANGDETAMMRFLNSSDGSAYLRDSPLSTLTKEEIVQRVAAAVDQYLPQTLIGRQDIGRALMTRDITGKELKAAAPDVASRPDVHGEQLNYMIGGKGLGGDVAHWVDRGMQGFYKVMNQLPSEILSKNPLFARMYGSHLKELAGRVEPGAHISARDYQRLENAARTRALRDVKRLTFNMDHPTRVAHSLRFVAPFFGAQMESWIRWSKIIGDKPQVAAHMVNLYNAPMRGGFATTFDGDEVDGYGYATNSVTGEKYKVDKSKIMVNMPVPKDFLEMVAGQTGRNVDSMRVPIDSLNLVLSGNPAFAPAWGPVVQIPASDLLTGGKLSPYEEGQWQYANFFKEIGILPYGPRGEGDWWDYINPATGRRLADSEDEFGAKYQKNLMQIMAEENWKFYHGDRSTKPDMKEVMERARQFSKFEMASNFFLPFSADFNSPLDFYSETYKKMVAADPENGSVMFRDKFGDSAYLFMGQLTRNNAGIAADTSSLFSSRMMQEVVDLSSTEFAGDLAHILSGPYATGDFSSGAYFYQLNKPVQSAGTEKQRERVGAVEAIDRAHASDGWYLYNRLMLGVQSDLYRSGFKSFNDTGAEELQARKQGIVRMISTALNPDGTANQYYNEQWAKDYQTLDKGKYDRFAANLSAVIGHPSYLALATAGGRTDLMSLTEYLRVRQYVNSQLQTRASQDINAKSNRDIKLFAHENVSQLIESDTRFNELHNRYFARDMGWDQALYEATEE